MFSIRCRGMRKIRNEKIRNTIEVYKRKKKIEMWELRNGE